MIDDVIFYIFDVFKNNHDIDNILKLCNVNSNFYKIGMLKTYEFPEVKFIRTINTNKCDIFLQTITDLFSLLNINDILIQHICKTDMDLITIILERKYSLTINHRADIYQNEHINDILNSVNNWCFELGSKSTFPDTPETNYQVLERIFERIYKYLIKNCTSAIKTDQLIIKASLYSLDIPSLDDAIMERAYPKYFYTLDMLCYIKIIYHAILIKTRF